METVDAKFERLKHTFESVAFLISSKKAAKEVHSEVVQGLVLLSELRQAYLSEKTAVNIVETDAKEINKVSRRLKLWAKRQNQINSRILNAYLKVERSGKSTILEADIKSELLPEEAFDTNFVQMKIIADKNHGKIFQQYGEKVCLWEPIVSRVREYEKIIFESRK